MTRECAMDGRRMSLASMHEARQAFLETGSIGAAAEKLGLSRSCVQRRLSRLRSAQYMKEARRAEMAAAGVLDQPFTNLIRLQREMPEVFADQVNRILRGEMYYATLPRAEG